MIRSCWTRGAAVLGGLALSTGAAAGVAGADPFLDPIVNTTCSYEQVVAAANAQSPLAAAFLSSPQQEAGLRQFIASPRAERQVMAEQIRNAPTSQPYLGTIQLVFTTCNNF